MVVAPVLLTVNNTLVTVSFVFSGVSCSTGYLMACFMGSGIRPCLCFECALVTFPGECREGQGMAGQGNTRQVRENRQDKTGQGIVRQGKIRQDKGGQKTADQGMGINGSGQRR